MNKLGVIRRVDNLGRVVAPKEFRKMLNIEDGDPVEIFCDGEKIIIKKFEESCIICGCSEGIITFKDKKICTKCRKEIMEW